MTAIPQVLEGYLDDLPVGDDDGLVTRFRVVSSPTDDATDETVWACRTTDPHLAHELLTLMRPGDLLRISGHLALPGPGDEGGPRLDVDALVLLAPRPPWARPRQPSTATAPTSASSTRTRTWGHGGGGAGGAGAGGARAARPPPPQHDPTHRHT
ncbi:hypothetical protein ACFUJ0_25085, partial [Streptomyces sp. NPDC057242]